MVLVVHEYFRGRRVQIVKLPRPDRPEKSADGQDKQYEA